MSGIRFTIPTKCNSENVVLLDYPFTYGAGSKRRPGLVLLPEADGDVLFSRITSQLRAGEFDLELEDWKSAGLAYPSVVRLSKMVSLHRDLILRPIGRFSERDASNIRSMLQRLLTRI